MATEVSTSSPLSAPPVTLTYAGLGAQQARRTPWLLLGLIALDTAALVSAFTLAYLTRFTAGLPLLDTPPHSEWFYMSVGFWAIPVWLSLFGAHHLYDHRQLFAGVQEYLRIVHASTAGVLAIVVISFLDTSLPISRGWLLLTWLLAVGLVGGARFVLRRIVRRLRCGGRLTVATVIVGANDEGRAVAEQFLDDPGAGTRIVGFFDNQVPCGTPIVGELVALGTLADLAAFVRHSGVHDIVVATTALSHEQLLDLYWTFGRDLNVELRLSSGLFEILTTGVRIQEVSSVPLVVPQRIRITGVDAVLKSTLDYLVASAGLLVLLPCLLLIALLIRLDSPGPVIHRRRVLGVAGRPFDAFKFRTMLANADAVIAANPEMRHQFEAGFKLRSDPRVTRLGRFLRRSSLDELPQLVNVLRGEMSLVGPRMIAPEEAGRYGKWQLNLLTVKPGLTGPWQVRGRSDVPYEQRIRLSMHYVRNYSIWLDLAILCRTAGVLVRGTGAY